MLSDFVAVRALDGAFERTKGLLWPFNPGVWLRIAVISFFIGGTGGGFNFPGQYTTSGEEIPGVLPSMGYPPSNIILLILGAVLLLLLIAVAFLLIGSILHFVFVDCLRTGEVSLTRYFRLRAGKGVRLLLFNVALFIFLMVGIVLLALLFFAPLIASGSGPELFVILPSLVAFFGLMLLLVIPVALIQMFTIDFVVPVMVRDDCGIIDGWRTVYPLLRREWQQGVAYIFAKIILHIAAAILMILIYLLVGIALAIPLLFLGALISLLVETWMVFVPLVVLFVILAFIAVLLVSVPFVTFFRYYSLVVLGALDESYNLLQ